jgi:hypothetical protein
MEVIIDNQIYLTLINILYDELIELIYLLLNNNIYICFLYKI